MVLKNTKLFLKLSKNLDSGTAPLSRGGCRQIEDFVVHRYSPMNISFAIALDNSKVRPCARKSALNTCEIVK